MGQNNNNNKHMQDSLNTLFENYNLSPQQIAVIIALLLNTLEVDSVLIDKDQTVRVILKGSLRRKTKADKLLDEISGIPIGELLDSLNRR